MTTANDVKQEIIKLGLEEIREAYDEDNYRRIGAEEGFELCRNLHTMDDFEKVIAARHRREAKMRHGQHPDTYAKVMKETEQQPEQLIECTIDEYWQHRYATLQIEFVYERLLVLWGASTVSAKAAIQVNSILEKLKEE